MDWLPFDKELAKKYLTTLLLAALVALFVRYTIFEAYRIPTQAMSPALEPGDIIIGVKPTFGLRLPGMTLPLIKGRMPRRGEVVIFQISPSSNVNSIRRVIGLPGDRVAVKGGHVMINGVEAPVDREPASECGIERLPDGVAYRACWRAPLLEDKAEERIPEDSVFVLSDLRQQPTITQAAGMAGRSWATVPVENLKAKASWIWLSVEPNRARLRMDRFFSKIR